jgi:hypothetical protein
MRGFSQVEFAIPRAVWGSLPSVTLFTSPLAYLIREWVASVVGVSLTLPSFLVIGSLVVLAPTAWIFSLLTATYCEFALGQHSRVRSAIRIFNVCAIYTITLLAALLLLGALGTI